MLTYFSCFCVDSLVFQVQNVLLGTYFPVHHLTWAQLHLLTNNHFTLCWMFCVIEGKAKQMYLYRTICYTEVIQSALQEQAEKKKDVQSSVEPFWCIHSLYKNFSFTFKVFTRSWFLSALKISTDEKSYDEYFTSHSVLWACQ